VGCRQHGSKNRHLPFPELLQYLVGFPAAGDVGKVRLVGQGGHDLVPVKGRVLGDALWLFAEGGEKQHPSGGEGGAAFRGNPHGVEGAGRANDDGLRAAQEDTQAFLFNRRVEAADDGDARVAQPPGGIVGAEDGVAGGAGGAEEGGLAGGKKGDGTEAVERGGRGLAQPLVQAARPVGVRRREGGQRGRHYGSSLFIFRASREKGETGKREKGVGVEVLAQHKVRSLMARYLTAPEG